MLRILTRPQRLCDGVSRRDFLRLGALGTLPLVIPSTSAAAGSFGRAKRCILLFLTGGPPQLDTFDPKPDAPAEIRGELKSIATRTPGLRFSELFPLLAARSDKLCVVRSVTHRDTVHTSAGYTMLTGVPHPMANTPTARNIRTTPNDHPHFGSLVARFRPAPGGVPTFAALPEFIRDDAINDYPGQTAGFLGRAYDPFAVEANPARSGFRPPEIALPFDVSAGRLAERRRMRDQLSSLELAAAADLEGSYRRAWDLIGSETVRQAFDLDREPDRVRAAYGRHLFGQGCLLARRLLEAGVSLVTVYWHYEGPKDSPVWDTHGNNFPHLRNRLAPPTDAAVAALLDDLAGRGLSSDTLVVCMGEFGRSPKVNAQGGRDHWPGAQSVLLAGVLAGRIVGATDRHASGPAELPIAPADLTATLLHLLGVPAGLEVRDRTGRPLPVCTGRPVPALLV
jgi:hypothetical protein